MAFIVDPSSVSETQILKNLKVWLANRPNSSKYTQFYEGEAGQIILELMSGISAYQTYTAIASTQNNYLAYTNNREAALAIASNTSYNVYRGRNILVTLRVTPSSNFLLQKYDPIGSVNGVDISAIQDYNFVAGQAITIQCVIGDVIESSLTMSSAKLGLFVFPEDRVSQDLMLLLNEQEVPYSLNIADMIKDYYYVYSNSFGGVTVQYLNNNLPGGSPLYSYNTGDILKIKYVRLQNLNFTFPDNIKLFNLTLDSLHIDTTIFSNYRNLESKESIQVNAPIAAEVQKLIRARNDFSKYFKILNSDFIDTSAVDVNLPVIYLGEIRAIPAFTDVSYVKSDKSLLLPSEKIALQSQLNSEFTSPHGIPVAEIRDPKEIALRLNLVLSQKPNTDSSTYVNDIQIIFDKYLDQRGISQLRNGKLGFTLNLRNLEYDLERLPYILIARASFFTKTWQPNTNYKRGEFILPTVTNGYMYEVISDTYSFDSLNNTLDNVGVLSNAIQPTWSTTINQLVFEGVDQWQPLTSYNTNDIVRGLTNTNFLYKCIRAGVSNAIEPFYGSIINQIFPDNSTIVLDSGILWQVLDPNTYQGSLVYKTHSLNSVEVKAFWNEYYTLNYGSGVTWL